jgi:hypothetical protein
MHSGEPGGHCRVTVWQRGVGNHLKHRVYIQRTLPAGLSEYKYYPTEATPLDSVLGYALRNIG